jgi:hypothetical protein
MSIEIGSAKGPSNSDRVAPPIVHQFGPPNSTRCQLCKVGKLCICPRSIGEPVAFPAESKLVPPEAAVFAHCSPLKSICLPPVLEFVGAHGFLNCRFLSDFALSYRANSRFRRNSRFLPVFQRPVSVRRFHFVLSFGRESRPRKVSDHNIQPIQGMVVIAAIRSPRKVSLRVDPDSCACGSSVVPRSEISPRTDPIRHGS